MSALQTADLLDEAAEELGRGATLLAFSTEDLSGYGALWALTMHLRNAQSDLLGADLESKDYPEDWSGPGGLGGSESKFTEADELLANAAGGDHVRAIEAVRGIVGSAQEGCGNVRTTVAEYSAARAELTEKVKACQEQVDTLVALIRKAFDEQMADAAQYAREAKAAAEEIAAKIRETVA